VPTPAVSLIFSRDSLFLASDKASRPFKGECRQSVHV
jgi:hypothetical protein